MTHLQAAGTNLPRVLCGEGEGSSQVGQLCVQDIDAYYLNKEDQEERRLEEEPNVEFDL